MHSGGGGGGGGGGRGEGWRYSGVQGARAGGGGGEGGGGADSSFLRMVVAVPWDPFLTVTRRPSTYGHKECVWQEGILTKQLNLIKIACCSSFKKPNFIGTGKVHL